MPVNSSTINGNAHIKTTGNTSTISGNAQIVFARTIFANAKIVVKNFVDIVASFTYTKRYDKDLLGEVDSIDDPVPAAPTTLTATDLGVGDSIKLDWTTSSASGYNVYKRLGFGSFEKVNNVVLGPSELSYIVGGLTTGTDYSFLVRGVNGQGDESGDSPIVASASIYGNAEIV